MEKGLVFRFRLPNAVTVLLSTISSIIHHFHPGFQAGFHPNSSILHGFFKNPSGPPQLAPRPGKGPPQKGQNPPYRSDDPGGALHHKAAQGEVVDGPPQHHPQQDEVPDLAVAVLQHEAKQDDADRKSTRLNSSH